MKELLESINNPFEEIYIIPEVVYIIYEPITIGGELIETWELCNQENCKVTQNQLEVISFIREYKES